MEIKNKEQKITINNTSEHLGWLKEALDLVKNYGIVKILITTLLIGIISVFFYFVFNPEKAFEVYETWKKKRHDVLIELRMENAPKIQLLLDKMIYKMDASRCMILELHNGTDGNGGLPFTKCSATYEGLNKHIYPVSQLYQNQNMSLIPFTTYLFKNHYWCGNTDDMMEIDRGLYHKMKSNGTEHFAAHIIEGIDKPLAFLIVSFDQKPGSTHNCDRVKKIIEEASIELSVFLEVEKRVKKFSK